MQSKNKTEISQITGMYQGVPAPASSCQILSNMFYDDKTKGWKNFFGYEKYFTGTNLPGGAGPYTDNGPVHSVFNWASHNGAKQHLLFEQQTTLYEINGSSKTAEPISLNRDAPQSADSLTCYETVGNYVVIASSNNDIIKYRGGNTITNVGWREQAAPPSIRSPASDPEARNGGYFLFSSEDFIKCKASGLVSVTSKNWPGVGSSEADFKNKYFYRCTFINENGSESPISPLSDSVTWTTTEFAKDGVNTFSRTGVIIEVPLGPAGTVARKIYRTRNQGTDCFFCLQVYDNCTEIVVDYLEDDQLAAAAPNPSDSIPFPSSNPRYVAGFHNRLFVDGGKSEPSKIYYSNALQIDSFAALNYFDIGGRDGGDITGLYNYYNNLFVFRERAIDVVRQASNGDFIITPFIQGIGCVAHSTICNTPMHGLVFLAEDGIYAIQGNYAGSELKLNKLSKGVDFMIEAFSRSGTKKAWAVYWPEKKEYWLNAPDYGDNQINIGIVVHENGALSIRDKWPMACGTVDYDGNLIFGHQQGNAFDKDNVPVGTQVGNGLMVISSTRQAGYVTEGLDVQIVDAAPIETFFRSQWHDFGYGAQKKQMHYLYLYGYTTGQQDITVTYYRDGDWHIEDSTVSTQSATVKMERADHVDQPNYTTDLSATYAAEWGATYAQEPILTEIRVPIAMKQCSSFGFEINTTDKFHFIGYSLEFTATAAQTIRGKK
mgnify:CR=1 FL=1